MAKLIDALGPDGMSSDEEDEDSAVLERQYKVKKLPWRRNMDYHMAVIDKEHVIHSKNRGAPGALPGKRVLGGSDSKRVPPEGLPINLYNQVWLKSKGSNFVDRFVQPGKEIFEWMEPV